MQKWAVLQKQEGRRIYIFDNEDEAGLKYFGERGETAVSKELKQFNVYDVFEPLYADKLSNEEKSKALTSS